MALLHDRYPVVAMDFAPYCLVYLRETHMDYAPMIMPPWFVEDMQLDDDEE